MAIHTLEGDFHSPVSTNVECLWNARFPLNHAGFDRFDRQLSPNQSGSCSSVLSSKDEGRSRCSGHGPLTIPQPVKHREEVDASMQSFPEPAHPASTSPDQSEPTEPVRLRECFVDVLAELAGRETATESEED